MARQGIEVSKRPCQMYTFEKCMFSSTFDIMNEAADS